MKTKDSCDDAYRTPQLDHAKILIADDYPEMSEILELILIPEGANIEIVQDGKQALKKITEETYDIVLMDLTLPLLSGEEAVKTLRKSGITIPIIALSAHPANEKRNQCLAEGFDDYISKPFHIEELIAIIKANLRKPRGPGAQKIETPAENK